jgi:hypothetical protein
MRLSPLTNVADDPQTMLINGLAQACTNEISAISALPHVL